MDELWIMKHTALGRFRQVQELVQCQYCEYCNEDKGDHWCHGWGWPDRMVHADGYCYKGERKKSLLDFEKEHPDIAQKYFDMRWNNESL